MKSKFPKVRIMKEEKPTYSFEKPNPKWKELGLKWIEYALKYWSQGEVYDVAYIPHIPLEIRQGSIVHNILPTKWNIEEIPNAANFYMGGGNNLFRLNARFKSPNHPFVGSKKNVDLSPEHDKEAILKLLMIAEKIYEPPR